MMIRQKKVLLAVLLCSWWSTTNGFSPLAPTPSSVGYISRGASTQKGITPSSLHAGFGGGAASSKKKQETKLKPKQQWDRYVDLKQEERVAVGVQIDGTDEWLDCGWVKSQGSKYTSDAVFKQRVLIAEHAKRLFPVQLSTKKQLQWGHYSGNDDEEGEWTVVDKSCIDAANEVNVKSIGFLGVPDPSTGFYCNYEGGRITNANSGSGSPIAGDSKKNDSKKKGPGDGVI